MLVTTTVAVALRCSNCGKVQFSSLSLFSFSAHKAVRLTCACRAPLLLISTKDGKIFYLQIDCLMCEGRHFFQYALKEIWSSQVLSLTCEETGLEVGFIGPRDQVRRSVEHQERSLREMAEDLGFADYFTNPEVMYEVLDCLHKIAEEGRLSCQCGNLQIEVEIFVERVELRCPGCGAQGVIQAGSREDLEGFKNIWEIKLAPGSLQLLSLGKAGKNRRSSKKQ